MNPVQYELEAFKRNCGPEPGMKYPVKAPGFEFMVTSMMTSFKNGWDMPPLIINYEKGKFDMSDGNHRFEALTRLGRTHYFIIFWTSDMEDYQKLQIMISNKTDTNENGSPKPE